MVEPADGHGNTGVINRAELHVCPPSVLQKTPLKARRWRVLVAPRYPSSSDDDSHTGVAIEFAPPPVDVKPDGIADVSNSDSMRALQMSLKLMMNCLLDVLPDQLQDIIVTDTGCLCLS